MSVVAGRQTKGRPDEACVVAGIARNRPLIQRTLGEVCGVDGRDRPGESSWHQVE